MKHITICADDYGQNPAISQAIIELIKKKALSATSCLVTSPSWQQDYKSLQTFINDIDIGLHFNLTEGIPLSSKLNSFSSLSTLILKSQLRQLDKSAISTELNTQIDCFVDTMHMPPTFIDGHQHIHQFPVIRDALLEIYQKRFPKKNCYVRCTAITSFPALIYPNKQFIINMCGGFGFQRLLKRLCIPHNSTFTGCYNFADAKSYHHYFKIFLQRTAHNGLIMCHPGLAQAEFYDPIQACRPHEYAFLSSNVLTALLEQHNVVITRFNF